MINSFYFDYNKILKCIDSSNIEFVSFDIFDTLLERPCIQPNDIFYIIEKELESTNNIHDFFKIRNIERYCRDSIKRIPSLDDIYDYIKNVNGFDPVLIDTLKKAELDCEYCLLKRRNLVHKIYSHAVKK